MLLAIRLVIYELAVDVISVKVVKENHFREVVGRLPGRMQLELSVQTRHRILPTETILLW